MTRADIDAVAEVHVRSWQSAYAGLIPRSYLDRLDVARNADRRRELFGDGTGTVENLVAEDRTGTVAGWACLGPYRDDEGVGGDMEHDGELYAIYVHPERVGAGIGRALTEAVTARATARGFPWLRLWVLEGNASARRFYERAGFAPDGGAEPFTVEGVDVPELRYAMRLAPPGESAPPA
jgi:ribosomal protein S18 acetylase RimI-like enzyme